MAHRRAKLTVFGRQLLVQRITELGWPVAGAAESLGVRRATPHRLGPALGHPRSTVYGVLRRHGLSRLADTDRATGVPVRYCREHPGELAHLDVKKLGRVPPGGGHRKLGRAQGRRHRAAVGYEYVHSLVDDCFRVA